jgi:hypothetical protein
VIKLTKQSSNGKTLASQPSLAVVIILMLITTAYLNAQIDPRSVTPIVLAASGPIG